MCFTDCFKNENLLPDSERLTRLGRFLRMTSMDPQISPVPSPGATLVKYATLSFGIERGAAGQAQIFADNKFL
jgi:hypothetical protein